MLHVRHFFDQLGHAVIGILLGQNVFALCITKKCIGMAYHQFKINSQQLSCFATNQMHKGGLSAHSSLYNSWDFYFDSMPLNGDNPTNVLSSQFTCSS